jgi:hypothetical protein
MTRMREPPNARYARNGRTVPFSRLKVPVEQNSLGSWRACSALSFAIAAAPSHAQTSGSGARPIRFPDPRCVPIASQD